ncbi:MAG: hypothetical protein WCO94_16440 [Verrucomicrobiota bacterium]
MKKSLLTICSITAMAVPAFAGNVFLNSGFETGNSNDWTLHSGTWNSNSQTQNDSHQGDSAVISNANATDANTLGQLHEVLSGNDSFRLNNAANGAHFSSLTQSVTNYGSSDLYFGFAAVLENPHSNPHTEAETPKFSFNLVDNTTNASLYAISFDSRNAVSQGITWHAGLDTNHDGTATWMFSDWNIVHIDASTLIGHDLSLTVLAYDCALGGHGGYAYIDAFQPDPIIANSGITVNHLNVTPGGVVVAAAAVPETSTWVMGFLALGAVGFMVRRSKASV